MDNDIIFYEMDDDGDSLDVQDLRPAPHVDTGRRNALMVRAVPGDVDDFVAVRLTRGSVERLRDALNEWLNGDGPVARPPEQTLKNLPGALEDLASAAERLSQAISKQWTVSTVEPTGAKESEQCCSCEEPGGTRKDIAGGSDRD